MNKHLKPILPTILLAFSTIAGVANAAPISGSAEFEGGVFGDWTINYSTGPSGVFLQQAKIILGSGNFFDTTSGAPGHLLWQDLSISASEANETGYVSADPPTAALRNGAIALTLFFNDFAPGESFSFSIDVDEGNICGGGLFGIACRLDGSLMTGNEFEGATIEYQFGGKGYQNTTIPASTYYSLGGIEAQSDFRSELAPVPEPSTIALLGAGLIAVGVARRRHFRR